MKKTTFLIAGKHAVTEALKNPDRKIIKIFLTEDSKKKLNKDNQNLDLLKNIKIFYKTKRELDRLCSREQISHQGLIAEIEHVEKNNLEIYSIGDAADLTYPYQNIGFNTSIIREIASGSHEISNKIKKAKNQLSL